MVVHELAHQWYGDGLSMKRWSDIWLNEGFATYAEWLWEEHQGAERRSRASTPPTAHDHAADDDPDFWQTVVADPGAAGIFDGASTPAAA